MCFLVLARVQTHCVHRCDAPSLIRLRVQVSGDETGALVVWRRQQQAEPLDDVVVPTRRVPSAPRVVVPDQVDVKCPVCFKPIAEDFLASHLEVCTIAT